MTHQFTRQELYEMVWAEPMSRLAAKLGISDVALAKACRRVKVPTPGLGYWAKLQHGKPVERATLPELEPGASDVVRIDPPTPSKPPVAPEVLDKLRAQTTEKIVVPGPLANAHPIVRDWLQRASGRLPNIERRRLRILSTLFKELERRGYALLPDSKERHNPGVRIEGEIVEFRLREQQKQLRVHVNPEDRHFSWDPEWRTELEPTGQLIFTIESWLGNGLRRQWRDTSRKQFEHQLGDIIAGLILAGAYLHQQELERAEQERQRRAEEQRRWEAEEARRKREKELQTLLGQINAWQRAVQIRSYVEEVRSALQSGQLQLDRTEVERWATWAIALADEIDPLKSGAYSAARSQFNVVRG